MSNPLIQQLQEQSDSLQKQAEATKKTLDMLYHIDQADAAILITSNQMQVRMLPVVDVGPHQAVNMLTAVIKTVISNLPNTVDKQKMINTVRNTVAAVDQIIDQELNINQFQDEPADVKAEVPSPVKPRKPRNAE